MTYSILYISDSKVGLNKDEIDKIMNISVFNNTALDISGFLVLQNGHFLQLLEGKENDVKMIFKRIKNDDRHSNIIYVLNQPTAIKAFDFYYSSFKTYNNRKLVEELKNYVKIISENTDLKVKKAIYLVEGILSAM